jgi:hypothetical protein
MRVTYFLAKCRHLTGIQTLLDLAEGLAADVRPVAYERLLGRMTKDFWWRRAKESYWTLARHRWSPRRREVPPALRSLASHLGRYASAGGALPLGSYVFADLDRLTPEETQRAAFLWRTLAESHPACRLLNHPIRSMRRYELLRNLYESGINTFNAYRVTEGRWPERYPVFLRLENSHEGPITPLLASRHELVDAIGAFERTDGRREELLVVEFSDTADARGIYRKYGAFVVGDRIVPKSLQFSRCWVQKSPDLRDPELLREEAQYVEHNPHEDRLREIFALARIQYGRIDYTILDGRVQVWEINTNPTIASVGAVPDARAGVKRLVLTRMVAAFETLSSCSATGARADSERRAGPLAPSNLQDLKRQPRQHGGRS